MTPVRVVLVTAPAGEPAASLARSLVESRVVACVNVVPGVRSFYWWDGAVQDDREDLLVCKTTEDRLPALMDRVRELHPYDVPEILALPVEAGHPPYVAWVRDETRPR